MPQLGQINKDSKSYISVWQACEVCGKERWVRLENGEPRNKLCIACWGKQLGQKYGEDNPHWQGGQRIDPAGYVLIRQPEHPRSNNGYVPRATLILERKLGRYLLPRLLAHHINSVKDDDRPENLEEVSRGDHNKVHSRNPIDINQYVKKKEV
ncbi:hypothetical protein ES703_98188 [subsurface metagenome]